VKDCEKCECSTCSKLDSEECKDYDRMITQKTYCRFHCDGKPITKCGGKPKEDGEDNG
jgi:hypothetical protein